MIPALRNCRTSPEPGWTMTATVSATSATSVSLWPDADGLDDDDVEGGRQRVRGRARGGRQPAQAPGGRRRADEHALVGRVEGDPRAVAQQRAARAPRRGVDREHRDAAPGGPPGAHELAQQRRLAGAGRAGDPDDVRARLAAQGGGGDLAQQRRHLLVGVAGLDEVEHRGRRRQVAVAQPHAELGARHADEAAAVALRHQGHDVAHDLRQVEVLGRVDRRDAGRAQRLDVGLGDDPADHDGRVDAAVAQRLHAPRGSSSRCEPERIDRPTTCTPSCSALAAICVGVRRMPS